MADLMEEIKSKISISDYCTEKGFHLERHGGRGLLKLKEHDSFIIDPRKNRFWWNSHDLHGSIIDLVVEMEGVSQQEAIKRLAARLHGEHYSAPRPMPAPREKPKPTAFELPKAEPKYWPRVYGYLIKERGIDPAIVKWLEKSGVLYPTEHANLCYVSAGYDGRPDYAAEKGTATGNHFRRVVVGGNYDARAAFHLVGTKPIAWVVCEAAVDCWSFMSLVKAKGGDWTRYAYLSLESCHGGPLRYHLEHSPPPPTIYLAQDNDAAGLKSRADCRALLAEAGYTGKIFDKLPPVGKDWNDTLKAENTKLQALCNNARDQAAASSTESTSQKSEKTKEREE